MFDKRVAPRLKRSLERRAKMKWRGVLVVLIALSLVAGVTTLAQGANVCPHGNVKYEVPQGYEYNDGSGWI
ncbi:MAG: hypothetical protein PHR64_03605, partial [Candidatus Shapirobacteria bacterium]|nr:hypothetical protein [Candidatus Shapirobacteria bacterium]